MSVTSAQQFDDTDKLTLAHPIRQILARPGRLLPFLSSVSHA